MEHPFFASVRLAPVSNLLRGKTRRPLTTYTRPQPHLFEAFYRGEDELTRKTKGMKTVEKTAHGPDQAADTGT